MNPGELLTRITIWVALILYAVGAGLLLVTRGRRKRVVAARGAWTAGCLFFIAHVVSAFHFYHRWSHADAFEETARQTAEMTGLRSGSGLYLNYLFGIVWLGAVVWWWASPATFLQRPRWISGLWNGFVLFMIFNGTVVFGNGPVRWLGVAICGGLAFLWWRQRAQARAFART